MKTTFLRFFRFIIFVMHYGIAQELNKEVLGILDLPCNYRSISNIGFGNSQIYPTSSPGKSNIAAFGYWNQNKAVEEGVIFRISAANNQDFSIRLKMVESPSAAILKAELFDETNSLTLGDIASLQCNHIEQFQCFFYLEYNNKSLYFYTRDAMNSNTLISLDSPIRVFDNVTPSPRNPIVISVEVKDKVEEITIMEEWHQSSNLEFIQVLSNRRMINYVVFDFGTNEDDTGYRKRIGSNIAPFTVAAVYSTAPNIPEYTPTSTNFSSKMSLSLTITPSMSISSLTIFTKFKMLSLKIQQQEDIIVITPFDSSNNGRFIKLMILQNNKIGLQLENDSNINVLNRSFKEGEIVEVLMLFSLLNNLGSTVTVNINGLYFERIDIGAIRPVASKVTVSILGTTTDRLEVYELIVAEGGFFGNRCFNSKYTNENTCSFGDLGYRPGKTNCLHCRPQAFRDQNLQCIYKCQDEEKKTVFVDYQLKECRICNSLCGICGQNTICKNCSPNSIMMYGSCQKCKSPCSTCLNTPDYCLSCLTGEGIALKGRCDKTCLDGTYESSPGVCSACASDCLRCDASGCIICNPTTSFSSFDDTGKLKCDNKRMTVGKFKRRSLIGHFTQYFFPGLGALSLDRDTHSFRQMDVNGINVHGWIRITRRLGSEELVNGNHTIIRVTNRPPQDDYDDALDPAQNQLVLFLNIVDKSTDSCTISATFTDGYKPLKGIWEHVVGSPPCNLAVGNWMHVAVAGNFRAGKFAASYNLPSSDTSGFGYFEIINTPMGAGLRNQEFLDSKFYFRFGGNGKRFASLHEFIDGMKIQYKFWSFDDDFLTSESGFENLAHYRVSGIHYDLQPIEMPWPDGEIEQIIPQNRTTYVSGAAESLQEHYFTNGALFFDKNSKAFYYTDFDLAIGTPYLLNIWYKGPNFYLSSDTTKKSLKIFKMYCNDCKSPLDPLVSLNFSFEIELQSKENTNELHFKILIGQTDESNSDFPPLNGNEPSDTIIPVISDGEYRQIIVEYKRLMGSDIIQLNLYVDGSKRYSIQKSLVGIDLIAPFKWRIDYGDKSQTEGTSLGYFRNATLFVHTGLQKGDINPDKSACQADCILCTREFECIRLLTGSSKVLYDMNVLSACPNYDNTPVQTAPNSIGVCVDYHMYDFLNKIHSTYPRSVGFNSYQKYYIGASVTCSWTIDPTPSLISSSISILYPPSNTLCHTEAPLKITLKISLPLTELLEVSSPLPILPYSPPYRTTTETNISHALFPRSYDSSSGLSELLDSPPDPVISPEYIEFTFEFDIPSFTALRVVVGLRPTAVPGPHMQGKGGYRWSDLLSSIESSPAEKCSENGVGGGCRVAKKNNLVLTNEAREAWDGMRWGGGGRMEKGREEEEGLGRDELENAYEAVEGGKNEVAMECRGFELGYVPMKLFPEYDASYFKHVKCAKPTTDIGVFGNSKLDSIRYKGNLVGQYEIGRHKCLFECDKYYWLQQYQNVCPGASGVGVDFAKNEFICCQHGDGISKCILRCDSIAGGYASDPNTCSECPNVQMAKMTGVNMISKTPNTWMCVGVDSHCVAKRNRVCYDSPLQGFMTVNILEGIDIPLRFKACEFSLFDQDTFEFKCISGCNIFPFVHRNENTSICEACPDGQALSNGVCIPQNECKLSLRLTEDNSTGICASCSDPLMNGFAECAIVCDSDKYKFIRFSKLNCLKSCPDFTYQNITSRTCEKCDPPLFKMNNKCISGVCEDGLYIEPSTNECLPCHTTCKSCTGPSLYNCTSCVEGTGLESLNETGACVECSFECIGCQTNYFKNCKECRIGFLTYFEGDSNDIISCKAEVCKEGYFYDYNPALFRSECKKCSDSYKLCQTCNATSCLLCQTNAALLWNDSQTNSDGVVAKSCLPCNETDSALNHPDFYFDTDILGCKEICGDGRRYEKDKAPGLALYIDCDDGNKEDGDGCDSKCNLELGYECTGGSYLVGDFCNYISQPEATIYKIYNDNYTIEVRFSSEIQMNPNQVDELVNFTIIDHRFGTDFDYEVKW